MAKFRPIWLALIVFTAIITLPLHPSTSPATAQVADLITIEIEQAGFGGLYRADDWTPLRVRLTNRGTDFSGRVVVRPETSNALRDTYTVPITDLARPIAPSLETVATTFLYLIADGGDLNLRVELLDDAGRTVAGTDAFLRSIAPRDGLYITIPPGRNLNLDTASPAGLTAQQADWSIADIPDRAGSLGAVDVIIFNDVDTSALTAGQTQALRAWVQSGGHLVVTGGDGGASTALADLLPFTAQGTTTADSFPALVSLAGRRAEQLNGQTLITTGTPTANGRILASTADDLPLIVRGEVGHGTVDFLTFNPSLVPFNRWSGMRDLWFTLFTSTPAQPGWATGFHSWDFAQTAVEILPGIDLLPSAWSLILFLGAYILIIGPLNYIVLSRLNRRGYAWLTIPIFIGIFSVLAYTVGFELRGNLVTLSRLSVVQTWANSEDAQVDQLVGLLAPRRGDYTLALPDSRLLRPLGRTTLFSGLSTRSDNIEIRQSNTFSAVNFPVDASFLAGFSTTGTIPRPAISGTVTVTTDILGNANLRGFVRNDSGITLQTPIIVTSGSAYAIDAPLAGGIRDFDTNFVNISVREPASPSALEVSRGSGAISGLTPSRGGRARTYAPTNIETLLTYISFNPAPTENELRELERRTAFLNAFIDDQYFSTGRGNRVFLIAWADAPVLNEQITNEQVREINTTLYIIELDVQHNTDGNTRTITQDQFTWVAVERDTTLNIGPVVMDGLTDLTLGFRFTPLPGAMLDRVDSLTLILDRGANTSPVGGTIQLWNWGLGRWETQRFDTSMRLQVNNPARFIGPLNAIQIQTLPRQVEGGLNSGTPSLSRIGIEQSGG